MVKKDKTLKDKDLPGSGPYIKINNDVLQRINFVYQHKELFSKFPQKVLEGIVFSIISNDYLSFMSFVKEGINHLEKMYSIEIGELQNQIDDLEKKVGAYRKEASNLESKLLELEKKKAEVDIITKNIRADYEKWKALYNELKSDINYKKYNFKISLENIGEAIKKVDDLAKLIMAENYDNENHELSMKKTFLIFFEWVQSLVEVGNYIILGRIAPYVDAYWSEIVMHDPTYLSKLISE